MTRMKRTVVVELDEVGAVRLLRTGYRESGYFMDELNLPDFAGAITKDAMLNPLVAHEVYEAICNTVRFVLGQDIEEHTSWQSFEVELLDGQTTEETDTAGRLAR